MKDFEKCYEEQTKNTTKKEISYALKAADRKSKREKANKISNTILFILFIIDLTLFAMWIHKIFNECEMANETEIEAFEPIRVETDCFEVPCPEVTPDDFYSSVENITQHSAVFKVTHYCGCRKCCGIYSDGSESVAYGASGKRLEALVSVAVDPSVIPLGTVLHDAEGRLYRAEDTGSGIKGNRIDLFVGDHQEALNMGVREMTLYW